MLEKLIMFINQYSDYIRFSISVLSFLCGVFIKKVFAFFKAIWLNIMLSMPNCPSNIIVPARYGDIYISNNKTTPKEKYITFEEASIILEINKVLEILRDRRKQVNYYTDESTLEDNHNTFLIGGFLANKYVSELINKKFASVKFGCSPETFKNHRELQNILISCKNSNEKLRWIEVHQNKDYKQLFSYNRDTGGYIVLAKLTGKADFNNINHGTVHICFGNNARTTLQSAKCYNKYRRELFRRLWRHTQHYFVIIECNNDGVPDFSRFHDLTELIYGRAKP